MAAYGMAVPGAVLFITMRVASNFFWNFNGQDFVGMGVPRVSASLKRGEKPLTAEDMRILNEKTGWDRRLYLWRRKVENLNWPNLGEEFKREAQAAPGILLISTAGFSLLKGLARMAPNALTLGRRSLELPHGTIHQYANTFRHAVADSPNRSFRDTVHDFYRQLLIPANPSQQQKDLLDKPLKLVQNLAETPNDADYTTGRRYLSLLKQDQVDQLDKDLPNLKQTGMWPFRQYEQTPVVEREHTLRHLIEEWAGAMADHAQFDLEGGKAKVFTGEAREKNHRLQARLAYYSRLLEDGVLVINQSRPATHLNQQDVFPVQFRNDAGQLAVQSLSMGDQGFLLHADKFRDFVVDAARLAQKQGRQQADALLQPEHLQDATAKLAKRLTGFRFGLTGILTAATMYYMWHLSHVIQSGRSYPANRTISESINAINHVATTSTAGGLVMGTASGQPVVSAGLAGTTAASAPLYPAVTESPTAGIQPATRAAAMLTNRPRSTVASVSGSPFTLTTEGSVG